MRALPLSARLNMLRLEDRCNPATAYLATDLIADQPGVAAITDPTLVNAWGISLNPNGGAFWVSANGAAQSEVYGGDVNGSPLSQPFKVVTPGGLPTGQVFAGLAGNFVVSGFTAAGVPTSAASAFIFASEGGTVTGWAPAVFPNPNGGPAPSRNAVVGFQATDGAAYTGMALANNAGGNFLYLTDFRNGKIDVLNGQFQKVTPTGSFADPNLPKGYAPFNVAAVGGKLYVSYAKQERNSLNPDTGRGNGFVSVFDLNGNFQQRLVSRGDLNAPWGMALAPAGFGDFGGALLVGNFGSGRIQAYNATTGEKLGTLSESPGKPVEIDGLWGLAFGNGKTAGDANSLYYAAGPENETHGLFGKITANAEGTNPVSATLTGGDLVITGSRNDDRVDVDLNRDGMLRVKAGGETIGTFDPTAVATIRFTGLAGDDRFDVDSRVSSAVFADGGAGDDRLNAGGGVSIMVGNSGDDRLFGGSGRDLLIGGTGRDDLFGFGNDDILIGGTTAHDANRTALTQISTAWNGAGSYTDRVTAIRTGANGVPKLDATTVFDDGTRDDLFGGIGLDWFFAAPLDKVHGKGFGEQEN